MNDAIAILPRPTGGATPPPSISIAGQAGAGAPLLAGILAKVLPSRLAPPQKKWRVKDASLVSAALAAGTFPGRLHAFLANEINGPVTRTVEEILSAHPRWSPMAKAAAGGVKDLFHDGRVILLSRDAHLLTSFAGDILHLQVVAPVEVRVRQVERAYRLSHKEAVKIIARCDRSWAVYLRKNFHCAGNTPVDFDLTINLGLMSPFEAVDFIADAVLALKQGSRGSLLQCERGEVCADANA